MPFIWDEAPLRNGSLLTLITDLGEIDLLGEVLGLGSYAEVKSRSIVVEACQAKRAAGRDKDMYALAELESLLEAEEP